MALDISSKMLNPSKEALCISVRLCFSIEGLESGSWSFARINRYQNEVAFVEDSLDVLVHQYTVVRRI